MTRCVNRNRTLVFPVDAAQQSSVTHCAPRGGRLNKYRRNRAVRIAVCPDGRGWTTSIHYEWLYYCTKLSDGRVCSKPHHVYNGRLYYLSNSSDDPFWKVFNADPRTSRIFGICSKNVFLSRFLVEDDSLVLFVKNNIVISLTRNVKNFKKWYRQNVKYLVHTNCINLKFDRNSWFYWRGWPPNIFPQSLCNEYCSL